jgi:glycerol-3-phosphate dehydrogenase
MAMRLADVLMRRLRLHSEAPADATRIAPAVARLMGQLLSWDEARETAEVAAYLALADRARQD